jgi:hypothetical protein
MCYLPDWKLVICTTEKSWQKLYSLFDCLFFEIPNLQNYPHDINNLMTNSQFWKSFLQLGCKHLLIFQHDSGLLKFNIDDFLQYDYVGAPWCVDWYEHGGNGGLSLRNPQTMYEICVQNHYDYSKHGCEDMFFSTIMYDQFRAKLAPREVCSEFSVEGILKMGTTGYHKIHSYHPPETVEKILAQAEVFFLN